MSLVVSFKEMKKFSQFMSMRFEFNLFDLKRLYLTIILCHFSNLLI